jgi:signal transduction histidine kinase
VIAAAERIPVREERPELLAILAFAGPHERGAVRLSPALETTAYFVVAEALTNAVKHAHADSARVTAVVHRGALRLEVRDDGIGGADRTRGTGLVGLADRVAAAGGTIAVISAPGQGTTIAVDLPLRTDPREPGLALVPRAARSGSPPQDRRSTAA